MGLALALHPESRCAAPVRIEVEAARRRSGRLLLSYRVTAETRELRLPPAIAPTRSDELWRHSCFEAFIRATPSSAYCELNFAPSTLWAAYRFSGYREGMRIERAIHAPRIVVQSNGTSYTLKVSLALDRLPYLPSDAAWQLGLAAVIEDTSGGRSYWALAHPPGKADFHHSDCFVHELPAA